MKTKITEMLGIEYPIIQGGMAWVAEHHLAAAVSEAGGLGLIGGANAPGEVVREEIRKARELTKKPFGVNVMLMSPHADDVAKVVVEEGIKVVTTGAGIPGKYMGMWNEAGMSDGEKRRRCSRCRRHGVRWTHRRGDDDDTRSAGSRCGFDSGDCSRRYRRWTRHCGGIYAGRRGGPDGNPLRRIEGIYRKPGLQGQSHQGERH